MRCLSFLPFYSFLLEVMPTISSAQTCPSQCSCSWTNPSAVGKSKTVDCDHISFGNSTSLIKTLPRDIQTLTIRHSQLESLVELCCFPSLRNLDLSFNQIPSILTYMTLRNLTYLSLKNNQLRILQKDEFSSFPQLEILNLENNRIEVIHTGTFRLQRLRELDLSNNKLNYVSERIFRYTPALKKLNLAGNQLKIVRDVNFYFIPLLETIDLSDNRIGVVSPRAFSHLKHLESINLASNNLSAVPSGALQTLFNLKAITLDGNPLRILSEQTFFNLSALETLHISDCPHLQLILSGAFSALPKLSKATFTQNPRLIHVSEMAFVDTPLLSVLDFGNSALTVISPSLLRLPSLTSINLNGNPLRCQCLNQVMRSVSGSERGRLSSRGLTCLSENGKKAGFNGQSYGTDCSDRLQLIPESDPSKVTLGSPYRLFCVNLSPEKKRLLWTLNDGTSIPSSRETTVVAQAPGSDTGRRSASEEVLYFSHVLASDRGTYNCRIESGNPNSKRTSSASVALKICGPSYYLNVWETASFYATIGWNQTLETGSDDAGFFIEYWKTNSEPPELTSNNVTVPGHSEQGTEIERIRIPLHVPWKSYSVTRLRPLTNYTFCLSYRYRNYTLYSSCAEGRTGRPLIGIGGSLNYGLFIFFLVILTFMCFICSARCIHKRFHIWQEEKYRSRIQESISGQSFLSSADSLNHSENGVTYENFQMSSSLYDGMNSARSVASTSSGKRSSRPTSRCSSSRPSTSRHQYRPAHLPQYAVEKL